MRSYRSGLRLDASLLPRRPVLCRLVIASGDGMSEVGPGQRVRGRGKGSAAASVTTVACTCAGPSSEPILGPRF